MAQRLDRNGIPVLDPPHQANKLKPFCHPAEHTWVQVGDRFVNTDDVMGIEHRVIESRCVRCGSQHLEDKAIDLYERRST